MYSPLVSGPTVYPENTVGDGREVLYLDGISATWHDVQSNDRQSDRRVTYQNSLFFDGQSDRGCSKCTNSLSPNSKRSMERVLAGGACAQTSDGNNAGRGRRCRRRRQLPCPSAAVAVGMAGNFVGRRALVAAASVVLLLPFAGFELVGHANPAAKGFGANFAAAFPWWWATRFTETHEDTSVGKENPRREKKQFPYRTAVTWSHGNMH